MTTKTERRRQNLKDGALRPSWYWGQEADDPILDIADELPGRPYPGRKHFGGNRRWVPAWRRR